MRRRDIFKPRYAFKPLAPFPAWGCCEGSGSPGGHGYDMLAKKLQKVIKTLFPLDGVIGSLAYTSGACAPDLGIPNETGRLIRL